MKNSVYLNRWLDYLCREDVSDNCNMLKILLFEYSSGVRKMFSNISKGYTTNGLSH